MKIKSIIQLCSLTLCYYVQLVSLFILQANVSKLELVSFQLKVESSEGTRLSQRSEPEFKSLLEEVSTFSVRHVSNRIASAGGNRCKPK